MCFGFNNEYHKGGIDDCQLLTDDLEEAKSWLVGQQNHLDYLYIYDIKNDEKICIEDLCT